MHLQPAIGTTRGYEQCFLIQPSVVNEDRLYQMDLKFIEEVDKEMEEQNVVDAEFVYEDNEALNMCIALDSHGWKPDVQIKIHEHEGEHIFKATIQLDNNARHFYKYVINSSEWMLYI